MLVIGEEMVEVCKPSIDYLQLAIEKSYEFIAMQDRKL